MKMRVRPKADGAKVAELLKRDKECSLKVSEYLCSGSLVEFRNAKAELVKIRGEFRELINADGFMPSGYGR